MKMSKKDRMTTYLFWGCLTMALVDTIGMSVASSLNKTAGAVAFGVGACYFSLSAVIHYLGLPKAGN